MSFWGRHFARAIPAAIMQAGSTPTEERSEHFPKAPGVLGPLAVGPAER